MKTFVSKNDGIFQWYSNFLRRMCCNMWNSHAVDLSICMFTVKNVTEHLLQRTWLVSQSQITTLSAPTGNFIFVFYFKKDENKHLQPKLKKEDAMLHFSFKRRMWGQKAVTWIPGCFRPDTASDPADPWGTSANWPSLAGAAEVASSQIIFSRPRLGQIQCPAPTPHPPPPEDARCFTEESTV